MHEGVKITIPRMGPPRFVLLLLLAFAAGGVCTGLFFHLKRSGTVRELDTRYAFEHGAAAETVGRLEAELGRERELNRELREHNSRARDLVEGLTGAAERNVRNLQDAIGLVGEIRKKLAVLEDLYTDSGSRSRAP